MAGRVYFLTYDGLCDHIAQSQILPYLLGLARRGWELTAVSCEKPARLSEHGAEVGALLRRAGVAWLPTRYHERAPSAALPLHVGALVGAVAGDVVRRRERPALLHARSYVAAAAAATLARSLGAPWIFDIRGFWFDEKVDAGSRSPDGLGYRVGAAAERGLFRAADAVVSLTRAAARPIAERAGRAVRRFTVIPTCVDLDRFRLEPRASERRGPVLGYVGSFGRRYLFDDVLRVFLAVAARRPDATLRVLTPTPRGEVLARARALGVSPSAVDVRAVPHAAVPAHLAEMDATLSLVEPGRSSVASCPTKFGESLAVGRPVVVNPGVGDCADIVEAEGVGVVFDPGRDDASTCAERLLTLLDDAHVSSRCRRVAEREFSLEGAIERYDALYRQLDGRAPRRRPAAQERAAWV